MALNARMLNILAKQQHDLVVNPVPGKPEIKKSQILIYHSLGVIFYPNEDGDVTDI